MEGRHIVGGEINYRCLGGGNYEITLLVYRDCASSTDFDSAPGSQTTGAMTIYKGNSQMVFAIVNLNAPVIENIDPLTGDPCLGLPTNSTLCLERGRYVIRLSDQNINLPESDESYFIVYQRCCRNNSINNIVNPSFTGATYYAELNSMAQASCNSSPVFKSFPPVLICANEPLIFDHSAIDENGDSLVYEICSPLQGGGQDGQSNFSSPNPNPDKYPPYDNVIFRQPNYTSQKPLGSTADVLLDAITGKLTALPKVLGQFVVGICVKEYRDGVLLSTTQRDFQFNVTQCQPVVIAKLDAPKVSNKYMLKSCGQKEIDLKITSDLSFVTAKHITMSQNNVAVDTNTEASVHLSFDNYQKYDGYLILNPNQQCTDTAFFEIDVIDVKSQFEHDTICKEKAVEFDNKSYSQYGITKYQWNFGDGMTSSAINPSHLYALPGSYLSTLKIEDAAGCALIDSQLIEYFPFSSPLSIDPLFIDECIPFTLSSKIIGTIYPGSTVSARLNAKIVDADSSFSLSTQIKKEGSYNLSLKLVTPSGCKQDTVFNNYVNAYPTPKTSMAFSPHYTDIYNRIINFEDLSASLVSREWFLDGESISQLIVDSYELKDTGYFELMMIGTNEYQCKDTVKGRIFVKAIAEYHIPNIFSPNHDNLNDFFSIETNAYVHTIKQLGIYDRIGDKVFYVSNVDIADPAAVWDGTLQGKEIGTGVYVYVAELILYDGSIVAIRGDITLIK